MREPNGRQIVLDYICIDSILFDLTVSEILYFKHNVGAFKSNVINFTNFFL